MRKKCVKNLLNVIIILLIKYKFKDNVTYLFILFEDLFEIETFCFKSCLCVFLSVSVCNWNLRYPLREKPKVYYYIIINIYKLEYLSCSNLKYSEINILELKEQ